LLKQKIENPLQASKRLIVNTIQVKHTGFGAWKSWGSVFAALNPSKKWRLFAWCIHTALLKIINAFSSKNPKELLSEIQISFVNFYFVVSMLPGPQYFQ
jgi:hypothetical protein